MADIIAKPCTTSGEHLTNRLTEWTQALRCKQKKRQHLQCIARTTRKLFDHKHPMQKGQ